MADIRDRLRVEGPVSLAQIDTERTPGDPGEEAAKAARPTIADEIDELQKKMWAQKVVNGSRKRILIVLQGMDCSGKGGVVNNVFSGSNPRWLNIKGFAAPTEEELQHHFLWRIKRALPQPGEIGIFDRSHYEDVVAVRARNILPEEVWRPRYEEINAFEKSLEEDDCKIIKIFLHISRDYQLERQYRRLDNPDKHWKFDAGDIEDRKVWSAFHAAYEEAFERCPTWYVVPSDHKWYRIWAVSQILLETWREMDLHYPARPDLDVPKLKRELREA
jgi:PPK2 family polyphosphate:nucleotide phosphotransferase